MRFKMRPLVQAERVTASSRALAATRLRAYLTLGGFVLAAIIALRYPFIGFAIICIILLAFIRPELIEG